MQRKSRRTLHIFVLPRAHLRFGHRWFRSRIQVRLGPAQLSTFVGIYSNSSAAYTPEPGKQSYGSHGTSEANFLSLKELEGILNVQTHSYNDLLKRQFSGKKRGRAALGTEAELSSEGLEGGAGLELDSVHTFAPVNESIFAKIEKLNCMYPFPVQFGRVDNCHMTGILDHVIQGEMDCFNSLDSPLPVFPEVGFPSELRRAHN